MFNGVLYISEFIYVELDEKINIYLDEEINYFSLFEPIKLLFWHSLGQTEKNFRTVQWHGRFAGRNLSTEPLLTRFKQLAETVKGKIFILVKMKVKLSK